ncbi:hypothetical protein I3842_02G032600 [Carya illinoinensis]|uniref:U3 snoRNP-associated protein-like EMB2271 n=1 Tax=Carya illinoinensis TaxID=32201 RepID=A0A922FNB5_CARIL|nr:hypothetical protein I3842_02G032600 [Carya illinoinensis]
MKKKSVSAASRGGARMGKRFSRDPFFITESSKKRRKISKESDVIESDFSDEDYRFLSSKGQDHDRDEEESVGEKRKRLAMAHLDKVRGIAVKEEEEDDDEEGEKEGQYWDLRVSRILQQEQLERTGRFRRALASRIQKIDTTDDEFRVLVKHRQSVTAVSLCEDDSKGFSASKDGTILHWDLDSGKREKYQWPTHETLRAHGAKEPSGPAARHSRHVLALDVSSDGRYLASGGLDRHIHLWDTRTRAHIQAFSAHKGPVSCLSFRQGTSELFSGSFDLKVMKWDVEMREKIEPDLCGQRGKIIHMDCQWKERVLTVGRDRKMLLFKVDENEFSQFKGPSKSYLECCCFISDDEYLSGSDDGSIERWSILRDKPIYIYKNAHTSWTANKNLEQKDNERTISSCHFQLANSWVNSLAVCRSSDLAASGAGNGSVRLWAIESETRGIQPLFDLPLVGFVNSLAFARSGKFLVAGVGQEPRLGRWGRIQSAQNGIAVHSLQLS